MYFFSTHVWYALPLPSGLSNLWLPWLPQTVRAHQAGSHHGKGWEQFTRAILEVLVEEAKNARPAIGPVPAEGQRETRTTNGSQPTKRPAPGGSNTLEQMFARAKRPKVDKGAADPPASTGVASSTAKANTQSEEVQHPKPGDKERELGSNDLSAKKDVSKEGAYDARPDDASLSIEEPSTSAKVTGQPSSRPPPEPTQDAATAQAGGGQSAEKKALADGGPEGVCRGIVFLAWGAQASKILADAGITDVSTDLAGPAVWQLHAED